MNVVQNEPSVQQKKLLTGLYYDASHPGSYGGVEPLVKASGLPRKVVANWLKDQWTYSLHKPARRRKFPLRKYMVRSMDSQWQADLVEMQHFSNLNRGHRYLMTLIDILSRHAWAVPIKAKSAPAIRDAFKILFTKMTERRPQTIQTDQGLEFENRLVRSYLREQYGIEQFSVKSEYKAAIVERFNRTLKSRMWRAFTKQGSYRWLHLLPKLLHDYNHRVHRTIGIAPADITSENQTDIWLRVHGSGGKPRKKAKFALGDRVRISRHKALFEKGYEPNWSEEEYLIHSVNTKYSPVTYRIRTQDNTEIIEGSFYDQELQAASDRDGYMRIDRIIRTRGKGLKREALVKWRGYKQPTWIKHSSIERVEDVPF